MDAFGFCEGVNCGLKNTCKRYLEGLPVYFSSPEEPKFPHCNEETRPLYLSD